MTGEFCYREWGLLCQEVIILRVSFTVLAHKNNRCSYGLSRYLIKYYSANVPEGVFGQDESESTAGVEQIALQSVCRKGWGGGWAGSDNMVFRLHA